MQQLFAAVFRVCVFCVSLFFLKRWFEYVCPHGCWFFFFVCFVKCKIWLNVGCGASTSWLAMESNRPLYQEDRAHYFVRAAALAPLNVNSNHPSHTHMFPPHSFSRKRLDGSTTCVCVNARQFIFLFLCEDRALLAFFTVYYLLTRTPWFVTALLLLSVFSIWMVLFRCSVVVVAHFFFILSVAMMILIYTKKSNSIPIPPTTTSRCKMNWYLRCLGWVVLFFCRICVTVQK